MPQPIQQELFLALVHLNDLGLYFLQQRRYRQAFATFNDAMELIPKRWKFPNDKKVSLASPVNEVDINALLERAQDRMSEKEVFPASESIKSCSIMVEDLGSSQDLHKVLDLLQQEVGTAVFRIGQTENSSNSKPSATANQFFSAIAMYNYGVAIELYAKSLPHDQRPNIHARHLRESQRWVRRSDSILKHLARDVGHKKRGNNVIYTILAVRTVVLLGLQEQVAGTKREEKVTGKLLRVSSQLISLRTPPVRRKSWSALAA